MVQDCRRHDLLAVFTSPENNPARIARALLEHACAVARKKHAERMALEVWASSHAVITLYQRSGFILNLRRVWLLILIWAILVYALSVASRRAGE